MKNNNKGPGAFYIAFGWVLGCYSSVALYFECKGARAVDPLHPGDCGAVGKRFILSQQAAHPFASRAEEVQGGKT